jgi:cytochrome c biogenesis protein CcmG/thiol:disulfide interchange protein DsbE
MRIRHPLRWAALTVGIVVAGLAVVLALQVGEDQLQAEPRSELLGDPAPAFTITTFDGEEISLDSLRGRAVILNFWNSWCRPCRQEEPALMEFFDDHRDDVDVALVGIVRDDTEGAARGAVDDRGIEWPIGMDRNGRAALEYGTRGQPETFAITPDGLIAGTQYGAASVEDLEKLLAAARGQAP